MPRARARLDPVQSDLPAGPGQAATRVLRLQVEYSGARFAGWQAQPGARTVQGELERALAVVLREPAKVQGASRTDAGVHALGQMASLETTSPIEPARLLRSVNALLDDDVRVVAVDEAPAGFHARFAASGKHYRYRLLNRPAASAVEAATSWHVPTPLDVDLMQAAGDALVGRHDFTCLAARASASDPRPSERDCVRTISSVRVSRQALPSAFDGPPGVPVDEPMLVVDVVGDGFLYKMVRTIVGTLVLAGKGRLAPAAVTSLLASGDRRLAGPTAPAHGLFLVRVLYEDAPSPPERGSTAEGVSFEGADHGPAHDGPRLDQELRGGEGHEARALLRSAP